MNSESQDSSGAMNADAMNEGFTQPEGRSVEISTSTLSKWSEHLETLLQDVSGDLRSRVEWILRELKQFDLISIGEQAQHWEWMAQLSAHNLGKQIDFDYQGPTPTSDFRLPRVFASHLTSIMTHLFRNAIDHGIEMPEERLKLRKSQQGCLLLRSQMKRNKLIFTFSDDGQGPDLDAITRRAGALNLLTPDQLSDPDMISVSDQLEWLFQSRFSSRQSASTSSGMGIGLSAVREFARNHGGNAEIRLSELGGFEIEFSFLPSQIGLDLCSFEYKGQLFFIPGYEKEFFESDIQSLFKLQNFKTVPEFQVVTTLDPIWHRTFSEGLKQIRDFSQEEDIPLLAVHGSDSIGYLAQCDFLPEWLSIL